jgi:hypothetical protein
MKLNNAALVCQAYLQISVIREKVAVYWQLSSPPGSPAAAAAASTSVNASLAGRVKWRVELGGAVQEAES